MTLLETLMPFIWFSGIAFTAYIFFHKFSDVIKQKFKTNITAHNMSKKGEGDIDNQMDKLIDNAPTIKTTLDREIEKQRQDGVSDDQMKGLISKKQMIDFVVDNKEIINIIGKPIIKKVLGLVKAI